MPLIKNNVKKKANIVWLFGTKQDKPPDSSLSIHHFMKFLNYDLSLKICLDFQTSV